MDDARIAWPYRQPLRNIGLAGQGRLIIVNGRPVLDEPMLYPSPADIEVMANRFPGFDPARPGWPRIRAALIRDGLTPTQADELTARDVIELLRTPATASPGPADDDPETVDTDELPPPLTPPKRLVLVTMERFDPSLLLSVPMIEGEMDRRERLSKETIRVIVNELIELRMAERPEGEKSGARLNMKGRRLARKIAD